MRRCLALLACACLGIGVLAVPALAAHAPSTVTITVKKGKGVYGKVTSPRVGCTQNREVGIYRLTGGGGNTHVGTDYTNASGKWHFPATAPGKYYAQVETTKHCAPNHSPNVTVN
jgi:hypothetical protein